MDNKPKDSQREDVGCNDLLAEKGYVVEGMDFPHDLDDDGEMEVTCRGRWSYINKHEAADLITHLQKVFNLS